MMRTFRMVAENGGQMLPFTTGTRNGVPLGAPVCVDVVLRGERADVDKVKRELEDVLAIDASEAILASAKEGIGIAEILEAIVRRIPPPSGDPEALSKFMTQLERTTPKDVAAYAQRYLRPENRTVVTLTPRHK